MHFTRGLRVQLAVVLNYAPGYQNEIEAEDRGMIPVSCLRSWLSRNPASHEGPEKSPLLPCALTRSPVKMSINARKSRTLFLAANGRNNHSFELACGIDSP